MPISFWRDAPDKVKIIQGEGILYNIKNIKGNEDSILLSSVPQTYTRTTERKLFCNFKAVTIF